MCSLRITVVVGLEGEVPVLQERQVEAGVHTSEPRYDILAELRAFRPLIARVPKGVAADADHSGPVREPGDIGANLEIGPAECGVEAGLAEEEVAREWAARGAQRVRGGPDRHVAVAPQVAVVGQPFAGDADLVVGVAELTELARARHTGHGVLVHVAVVVPVDAHAQEGAADELLTDGPYVREETSVDREVAPQVGRPEAAQVVLGVGNKAAERHVAAVVAEATVGGVDAVVEPAGPVARRLESEQ